MGVPFPAVPPGDALPLLPARPTPAGTSTGPTGVSHARADTAPDATVQTGQRVLPLTSTMPSDMIGTVAPRPHVSRAYLRVPGPSLERATPGAVTLLTVSIDEP